MEDLDSVECFNPLTQVWESLPPLPVPRWGLRAVSRGGQVFILGGHTREGETRQGEHLDFSLARWSVLPPLKQQRRSFGFAAVLT
mmetsp:Transcript_8449/g.18815  ORF Transcript_8449/g.18815 Transcript_8449/m.18815 type:complete len:85 (+) Transcript_8449:1-255(+)